MTKKLTHLTCLAFLLCGCSGTDLGVDQIDRANLMPEPAAKETVAKLVGRTWATQPYVYRGFLCGNDQKTVKFTDIDYVEYNWAEKEASVFAKIPNSCNGVIVFSPLSRDQAKALKQALIALGAQM
jgi:hypothetical protein